MKAAVLEQTRRPIVIRDVPDPRVGPGDVLIRVQACGVCHSDLHLADGSLASLGLGMPPLILGHEVAGTVAEVGSEVTRHKPGDRVGVYYTYSCGQCRYCLAGEEEVCPEIHRAGFLGSLPGGYADYLVVPAANVMPLPTGLDVVDAAPLFCAGLTVYGALKNAGLRPGQRAAVLGIGGLGHLGLAVARAMGAEVIALTSTEAKADLARQMGAHHVIAGEDMGRRLRATGGADVILSTTIDTPAMIDAMQGLGQMGTLVLTGLTMEPLPIIPTPLIAQQQRVIGSAAGSRADMRELLQFAASHGIRPMTQTYVLEEANCVHEQLTANNVRFRAVLTPE
jgi:D-arabinose 1-dehydrogenase-like Zn-dependent alcohol dehydrogenase